MGVLGMGTDSYECYVVEFSAGRDEFIGAYGQRFGAGRLEALSALTGIVFLIDRLLEDCGEREKRYGSGEAVFGLVMRARSRVEYEKALDLKGMLAQGEFFEEMAADCRACLKAGPGSSDPAGSKAAADSALAKWSARLESAFLARTAPGAAAAAGKNRSI